MPDYEIWDVFTDTPLEGNALGLFPHGEEIPSRLYPKIARELNLSETVFVLGEQIRIFTPALELPFAGHPTLGAAFHVAHRDGVSEVTLQTGRGPVQVSVTLEPPYGEMRQPYPQIEPHDDAEALLAAVGVEAATTPVEQYTNGPTWPVLTIADREALTTIEPDLRALKALGGEGVAMVAQTGARAAAVRVFVASGGPIEDPATGSAAGPVALHLVRHGQLGAGQTLEISQGTEIGRPSRLFASAVEGGPVKVGGAAVRVANGHYRLS